MEATVVSSMSRLQGESALTLLILTFTTRMIARSWRRLEWGGDDEKYYLVRSD